MIIKTIYMLWFQGYEESPDIVKKCYQSWKKYNPDWIIIFLDNNNITKYIDNLLFNYFKNKNMLLCHLSDIIRCILLMNYGGLWIDSTVLCNMSLNNWLEEYIKEGFFAFSKPTKDRMLCNWFLYSEKDNYIIKKWCEKTIEYYTENDYAETYFIHHYIFEYLYKTDLLFKRIWINIPVILSNNVLFFNERSFNNELTPEIKKIIDEKKDPLYKLTYKKIIPKNNIKILEINYLLDNI